MNTVATVSDSFVPLGLSIPVLSTARFSQGARKAFIDCGTLPVFIGSVGDARLLIDELQDDGARNVRGELSRGTASIAEGVLASLAVMQSIRDSHRLSPLRSEWDR